MVKFAAATSVALLAATAAADEHGHGHKHGHKHMHNKKPVEYSTATVYPVAPQSTYAVVETHCGVTVITVTAEQPQPTSTYVAPTYAPSQPAAAEYYETTPAEAPTYPASTPAAVPSYSAAPAPAIGGTKKGLAYQSANLLSGFKQYSTWAWNWNSESGGLNGYEYVPILNNEAQLGSFKGDVGGASGCKAVMAFNEPDMNTAGGGSALTPQQAASYYKQYIQPYAGQYKLGSPSVTSDNTTTGGLSGVTPYSGIAWLQEFAKCCDGCTVDFAPIHWYGAAGQSAEQQASTFKTYVEQATKDVKALFGDNCKLWLTEFSALPTINEDNSGINEGFIKSVIPYLESCSDVERYSYYFAAPNYLIDNSGALTPAGEAYCSA